VPGSQYDVEVYATSVCGKSLSMEVKVKTRMEGKHFMESLRWLDSQEDLLLENQT